jgi:hypothetical protein
MEDSVPDDAAAVLAVVQTLAVRRTAVVALSPLGEPLADAITLSARSARRMQTVIIPLTDTGGLIVSPDADVTITLDLIGYFTG